MLKRVNLNARNMLLFFLFKIYCDWYDAMFFYFCDDAARNIVAIFRAARKSIRFINDVPSLMNEQWTEENEITRFESRVFQRAKFDVGISQIIVFLLKILSLFLLPLFFFFFPNETSARWFSSNQRMKIKIYVFSQFSRSRMQYCGGGMNYKENSDDLIWPRKHAGVRVNRAKMRAHFPSMRCGIDREERMRLQAASFFFSGCCNSVAEYSQVRNASLHADTQGRDRFCIAFYFRYTIYYISTHLYTHTQW